MLALPLHVGRDRQLLIGKLRGNPSAAPSDRSRHPARTASPATLHLRRGRVGLGRRHPRARHCRLTWSHPRGTGRRHAGPRLCLAAHTLQPRGKGRAGRGQTIRRCESDALAGRKNSVTLAKRSPRPCLLHAQSANRPQAVSPTPSAKLRSPVFYWKASYNWLPLLKRIPRRIREIPPQPPQADPTSNPHPPVPTAGSFNHPSG